MVSDAWPRRGRLRPWVLGHRGARREAPENTLLAFERAMTLGADGVEFDVRLSSDGVPVVCHDTDLGRITDGRDTRRVSAVTAYELGQIELAQGARIPTLSEVLHWSIGAGAMLDIELKGDSGSVRKLAAAVAGTCHRDYPADGPCLVLSSFHLGILLALRALGCQGELALLTDRAGPVRRYGAGLCLLGITGVFPEQALLCQTPIDACHRHGRFIGTWTANSEAEVLRANQLGVDVIIGDDPALLRRLVS